MQALSKNLVWKSAKSRVSILAQVAKIDGFFLLFIEYMLAKRVK